MSDDNCIFCKIARGEVPSKKVYEDDVMLAFHDIHPVAPVHFMVIPKAHIASFAEVRPEHESDSGNGQDAGPDRRLADNYQHWPRRAAGRVPYPYSRRRWTGSAG